MAAFDPDFLDEVFDESIESETSVIEFVRDFNLHVDPNVFDNSDFWSGEQVPDDVAYVVKASESPIRASREPEDPEEPEEPSPLEIERQIADNQAIIDEIDRRLQQRFIRARGRLAAAGAAAGAAAAAASAADTATAAVTEVIARAKASMEAASAASSAAAARAAAAAWDAAGDADEAVSRAKMVPIKSVVDVLEICKTAMVFANKALSSKRTRAHLRTARTTWKDTGVLNLEPILPTLAENPELSAKLWKIQQAYNARRVRRAPPTAFTPGPKPRAAAAAPAAPAAGGAPKGRSHRRAAAAYAAKLRKINQEKYGGRRVRRVRRSGDSIAEKIPKGPSSRSYARAKDTQKTSRPKPKPKPFRMKDTLNW